MFENIEYPDLALGYIISLIIGCGRGHLRRNSAAALKETLKEWGLTLQSAVELLNQRPSHVLLPHYSFQDLMGKFVFLISAIWVLCVVGSPSALSGYTLPRGPSKGTVEPLLWWLQSTLDSLCSGVASKQRRYSAGRAS